VKDTGQGVWGGFTEMSKETTMSKKQLPSPDAGLLFWALLFAYSLVIGAWALGIQSNARDERNRP
jgi:hypothetical protein